MIDTILEEISMNATQKLTDISRMLDQNGIIQKIRFSYAENCEILEDLLPTSQFLRDHDLLWFYFEIIVPDEIAGLSTEGSPIRLIARIDDSIELYVDDVLVLKEKTWVDFKNPEVYITDFHQKQKIYTVRIKLNPSEYSFSSFGFNVEARINAIDDIRFDIESFITEIEYAQSLESSKSILPAILNNIEKVCDVILEQKTGIPILQMAMTDTRLKLEICRDEAKQRCVHMIGHAHIDMNWLWDMDETTDLVKRDFTTMCNIMDEEETFCFSQSQCAAYDITKNEFPDLFSRVREKIAAGNWDVTASAWVENDLNISNGESIARHILYSKKFLKQNFSIEPTIMWCPDTFGHSANIPQILKQGGIENYFFSRCGIDRTKAHTEDNNRSPDVPLLIWEGLDGSQILAANMEYSNEFNCAALLAKSNTFYELGLLNAIYVYGVGDHGGGPTKQDIKRIKQSNDRPTLPRVKFSKTSEFYDVVRAEGISDLEVRTGEMNFVFEGCYTTHADIKKGVRILENRLYTAETLSLMANQNKMEYNAEALENCWKTVLFHQFHDIFDGCATSKSSIEAVSTLKEAFAQTNGIIQECLKNIRTKDDPSDVMLFNPHAFPQDALVRIPINEVCDWQVSDQNNNECISQRVDNELFIYVPKIDALTAMSLKIVKISKTDKPGIIASESCFALENEYYYVEVSRKSGELVTFYDKKAGRYIARKIAHCVRGERGILNTLAFSVEQPNGMSAWMVSSPFYTKYLVSDAKVSIKADGEVVKIIHVAHSINSSVIEQDIIFKMNSPVIDFVTKVDWNEKGGEDVGTPRLHVAFAPEIENIFVMDEIPFGTIKRTTKNAITPHLRFSAIEDEKGSFAVLNDCKYGGCISGNQMELTLIRSGWNPDPESDIGKHEFTYSIYSTNDMIAKSDIIKKAIILNIPMEVFNGAGTAKEFPKPVFEYEGNSIVISSMKMAEDGSAMIIRMYEPYGEQTKVNIKLDINVIQVFLTDLNESIQNQIFIHNDRIEMDFSKNEIKTIKIYTKQ